MGWWKADDGVGAIGDGPADALSEALARLFAESGARLPLQDVLSAFAAALALNPKALVGDPESLATATIVARCESGAEYRAASPGDAQPDASARTFYAAIEDAATHYRDVYERKPSVAELLETLAFVVRGREEVEFPGDCELDSIGLGALRDPDAPSEAIEPEFLVVLPAGTMPADVGAAASVAKDFARDPDRGSATAGRTFASWSGREGGDREIDFYSDTGDGSARLEIRGKGAKALAEALSREMRAHVAPSPEAALADLMTPPPGGPPTSRTGTIRWRSLQAALATPTKENATLLRSMVAAGLRDPDWRVRMLAVLATGRLRLAGLAEDAMAAKVPEAGTSGLGQEDRRALLALRHAAHNLAAATAASHGIVGEPGVMERRVAEQERLRRLIMAPPAKVIERTGALVAILTGETRASELAVPGAWREWTDE